MQEPSMKETIGFQAEVEQVLHLVIHSLYSHKEIFLRELISNASDALEKLRFESLRDPMLLAADADLKVWVTFDKDAKTITIRDNGIGMTKEELIRNLGTIAKSGTREFLKSLTGDKAKDAALIGQFGVGFYSSFMVADKVVVTTLKAGSLPNEAVRWSSDGKGQYEVEYAEKQGRGTDVVLHLKKEEEEFLNDYRLKHIITKYSDHLTVPIVMKNEKNEDEVVNRATALWTLPKSDISDEQYKELYKHVAHDFEDPLIWSHNKVEGKLEYITVLYIPARAPFDLWHTGKARGLKLYIQRVFIMDDAEQFLPHYLRFARGVIDSNDLPLNISREMLQSNRVIDAIRNATVKRLLGMLEELATQHKEKYQQFWKEFGQVLKEGPAEDFANKEAIAKLLRFASTHTDLEEQTVTLEEYLGRMKATQDKIYYVTAETFTAAKHSPHLEIFRKLGIEVLLMSDRIDEWLMTHLNDFQGKHFQSVARGNLNLEDLQDKAQEKKEEQEYKQAEEDFDETLKQLHKVLGLAVKEVRLSRRLTDSPACIVVDEKDMSTQMERILRSAGQKITEHKPILEINATHPMVKRIKGELGKTHFEDWAHVLLDQAILAEGGQLTDPARFVQRLNSLLLS